MRLLVTGAGGLLGSNLAAAAAQQSWSVLGTWRHTPVSVHGARTASLDVSDRRACVELAEGLEPDVIVHAAAESALGRLEREPDLAELNLRGAENTLAAAHAVHARYVLVSCDLVFSGLRPAGECWEEEDPTEPASARGRALLACEHLVQRFSGSWLITRPAEVYGVNLATPTAGNEHATPAARDEHGTPAMGNEHGTPTAGEEHGGGLAWASPSEATLVRARYIWERSGLPLRWVAWLRAGRPLAAPPGIQRSPTYAWDYAQRVCDLIAQECEGIYNTAGPTILGKLAHLRLLARAFECDMELVQEGSPAAFLRASGEALTPPPGAESATARGAAPEASPPRGSPFSLPPLPANTALCDHKASFVLGRQAVDPFSGHRLMRRQLERLLGEPYGGWELDPPPRPPDFVPAVVHPMTLSARCARCRIARRASAADASADQQPAPLPSLRSRI